VTEWWARSLGKGHSASWSGGQYVRGAVRLCEIPKVATKQFDIIFSNTGYRTKPLATKGGWEHPKGPGNHFNIVFYRDPLEVSEPLPGLPPIRADVGLAQMRDPCCPPAQPPAQAIIDLPARPRLDISPDYHLWS